MLTFDGAISSTLVAHQSLVAKLVNQSFVTGHGTAQLKDAAESMAYLCEAIASLQATNLITISNESLNQITMTATQE